MFIYTRRRETNVFNERSGSAWYFAFCFAVEQRVRIYGKRERESGEQIDIDIELQEGRNAVEGERVIETE